LKTVDLGDRTVPAVGQGTGGVGGLFERVDDDEAEMVRLLQLGCDLGLTVIDTAEVYGGGYAEELVGKAVAGARDKAVIVSKFSPEHSRADAVIAAADASLKRLGTDYLDVYMPHWPNPKTPLSETVEAMDRLVQAGKVRYAGMSNFQIADARATITQLRHGRLVCLENEYSLLERSIEAEILPFCAQEGLALIAYSPYCGGKLFERNARTEPLFEMAADHGATVGQLALAWLLRSGAVLAIPKASTERKVRENAAVLSLAVPQTDLDRLSVLFAPQVELVPIDAIDVPDADDGRHVYKTLEEALENRLGMSPSPRELSEEIRAQGTLQKPIKLRYDSASGRYLLLEGRLKYWGWVIGYGGARPIPALVETGASPN